MVIFAETPEEILAEVTAILEDADVKGGETILHQDDVDGRIRNHFAVAQGIIRMLCRRVRAREYEG